MDIAGGGTRGEEKYAMTDCVRMMEIMHVQDMAYNPGYPSSRDGNHSQNMLMVHLPKEKIFVNADLYLSPEAGAQSPAVTSAMKTLY